MRAIFILATVAVVAGGLLYTIKLPDTESSKQLLSNYQKDPEKTLQKVESGIATCVPGIAKSRVGTRFTRSLIAPMYLKVVDLRVNGNRGDDFDDIMKKWISANHPDVLALPDAEFLELAQYLKSIGDDDIEICILSSVV